MKFRVNEVNVRENVCVNLSVWSDLACSAILKILCRLLCRKFIKKFIDFSWKAISNFCCETESLVMQYKA